MRSVLQCHAHCVGTGTAPANDDDPHDNHNP
jgi:hypothetical protein